MVGVGESLTLNCEVEGNLHLLIVGLHVLTQNKFVTKTLFIFHKSVKMPIVQAKWPMDLEMIQKLPMFVSYCLV